MTAALLSAAACMPAGAPAPRTAPVRSAAAPTSASENQGPLAATDGGIAATAPDPALFPQGAARDSIDRRLADAISLTSSIFGVPDSLARAASTFVDVDSTSMPDESGTTWDIDVESYVTKEKVARYVDLFAGRSREYFATRLQRGKKFEPMIRSTFRAQGIPEDMYFLALVESGYDHHAYSSAAAVGMWQFMSTTARGIGLRVDWWVDERRDPIRSTWAAGRFLGDLRDQFGSLYLAAAAYNGGPGRVSRGLKKYDDKFTEISGEDCFFALAEQDHLRAETKNYVPQLIAAALLGKDPSRYGIFLDSVAPYAYDTVRVPEGTPLGAVAKAIGMTVRDVSELNGHFLRGLTPPGDSSWVRVPLGKAEGFSASFAALSEEDLEPFTRVTSRKGQTMASIAAAHGLAARQLAWYNRKVRAAKSGRLVAGQLLLVPTPLVVAAALDVPDPSIERYGPSAGRGRVTHVVRRGESLSSIARRYKTSVSSLVALNRLKKRVVYAGQTIIVRGGSRPAAKRSGVRGARTKKAAKRAPARGTTAARSAAKKSSP